MKSRVTVAAVLAVGLVVLPTAAEAREGWYIDLAAGPNVHILADSLRNNYPYGAQSDAEIWYLQQFNYGYSFSGPFSLGLGMELDNFIDVEFKANLKWSFLEEEQTQPYVFVALHGGIADVSLIAGSVGFGVDHFITDHVYWLIETRAGPAFVSDVPERDFETGDRFFRWRIDAALSFGLGYSFGGDDEDGDDED